MENYLLILLILFCLSIMRLECSATSTTENYWKVSLPNTPMPQFIKDQIFAPTGLGGPPCGKGSISFTNRRYLTDDKKGLESTQQYDGLLSYGSEGLKSTDSYSGLLSYKKKELASTDIYGGMLSYGNKGLKSTDSYNGLLSYKKKELASTDIYAGLLSYRSERKESIHEDTNIEPHKHVFFIEKDLHLGKKLSLHFQKSTRTSLFLPREVSNTIPFSSNKVQETLGLLSINPNSHEAYVLSKRIELCEEPTIEGVEKKCVTSLESMVDYVISLIGIELEALTTRVEKDYSKMEYTIQGLKKLVINDGETVVCHKMGYPYAVNFCHRTRTIRSYMVKLLGIDGTEIEAVAVCHKETNDFLENYEKNVLKIVPGSTYVCHFPAAEDTIIWVRK